MDALSRVLSKRLNSRAACRRTAELRSALP